MLLSIKKICEWLPSNKAQWRKLEDQQGVKKWIDLNAFFNTQAATGGCSGK